MEMNIENEKLYRTYYEGIKRKKNKEKMKIPSGQMIKTDELAFRHNSTISVNEKRVSNQNIVLIEIKLHDHIFIFTQT